MVMLIKPFRAFYDRLENIQQYVQRPNCYMGNNRVLTRTIHGHKMYLDSRDISLTPHLIMDGYWEDWVTTAIKKIVKPGDKVVDVGANVGYFSLLMADIVGESGFVWAVEANPEVCELASLNIEVNGYREISKVFNCVAYSSQCSLEFKVYEKHKGSSSLYVAEGHPEEYHDSVVPIAVDAQKLDALVGDARVNLIKIDAEGSEPEVLRGAASILERSQDIGIVMEFAPQFYVQSDSGKEMILDLDRRGFEFNLIEKDGRIIPIKLEALLSLQEYFEIYARKS